MLKQISKIQDFGILQDCKKNADLKPFNKFNIIYGWNGSGKTTLGRLLRCLQMKCNHKEFANARYQIELYDGSSIDSSDIDHSLEIRVFNQDFIAENLNLFDATTNPIIFISKEKVDEKKQFDEARNILKQKLAERDKFNSQKEEVEKAIEKTHKDAGKAIKDFFLGTIYANVTYNVRTSKDQIWPKLISIESLKSLILSDEEITKNKSYTLLNSGKDIIDLKSLPSELDLEKLTQIEEQVISLLEEEITSKAIERLKDSPELNVWVKTGLHLHKTNENSVCDFCGNKISEERIQELNEHFNEEYEAHIEKAESLISTLNKGERQSVTKSSHLLYDEVVGEYNTAVDIINSETEKTNSKLKGWISLLQEKQKNPFKKILSVPEDKSFLENYNNALRRLIEVLKSHNELSNSQKQLAQNAKDKIEKHFVGKHAISDNLRLNEIKLKEINVLIKKHNEEIKELSNHITELENDLKSDTIAISEINDSLHKFLGRNDIILERLEQGGYELKRNGVVARNLSEGEKTAISLIYFFSKIQENDADLKNLIVAIDDPVSSFDSNHLFNASAYIKNIIDKALQVFVLTHNFWFFKQVRDWMAKKNENERKKQRPEVSNMYLVERGNLKNATQPLMKFHSEYQHVFYTILSFCESETCDDSTCFAIANVGRRLLEAFNSFKTPDNSGFNSIFELAKKKGLDDAKKDRVFFFLNKYSHLDRIESFDNTIETLFEEGRNVAKDILWIIKKIDIDHYQSMLRTCGFQDVLEEKVSDVDTSIISHKN